MILFIIIMLLAPAVQAHTIHAEISDQGVHKPRWAALPYAFHSESLAWAWGIGGGASGYLQRQMGIFGAIMNTSNSSRGLYIAGSDIRIPIGERLYLDSLLSSGDYSRLRSYTPGNPLFNFEMAGSNDSHDKNFIQGSGTDNLMDLKFKYLLPLGAGRHDALNTYTLSRGILVEGATGGEIWNPLSSGRSFVEVMPFYRNRDWQTVLGRRGKFRTSGIRLSLEYDNRDLPANPSKGSRQLISVTRDAGSFDSTDTWTNLEASVSKYIPLGLPEGVRQQVLALNLWTACSPTWNNKLSLSGLQINNRPPPYLGSRLGGYQRLRAFPMHRFSDKAAIYYAAEYRIIPTWNPLGEADWLRWLALDWWQPVAFVELGRVADSWNLKELHSHMQYSTGLGLRIMVQRAVLRSDVGFSNGNWAWWAMVGHTF